MKNEQPLNFKYLANSPEFAELSRIVYTLTGLCVVLIDPLNDQRKTYTYTRGRVSRLCRLIHNNPDGNRRCARCNAKHFVLVAKLGHGVAYTCHAGLIDIAIPVFSEGHHVATISTGQILPAKPSAAGFRSFQRRLRYLGVAGPVLRRAYDATPYLEKRKIFAATRLLMFFAEHLCQVAVHLRDMADQHAQPAIYAAKQYVQENLREPLSMGEVAQHVHLSASYFSDLFRRSEGVPFIQYVQRQRIREVCRLLETTRKRVTEISLECGFNSFPHFNRVFHKFLGCSPIKYRRRAKKRVPQSEEKKWKRFCLTHASEIRQTPREYIG